MSTKEVASNQKHILAMNSLIASDTTTYSAIIDTAKYDGGVQFSFMIVDFDNTAADCECTIQEGLIANMSDAADISDDKLVYKNTITLSAANVVGSNIVHEGVFSNERYLRIKVVSSGIDTNMQIVIVAVVNPEVKATDRV